MPTRKTFFWLLAAAMPYLIAFNVGSGWLYIVAAVLIALPLAGFILGRLNGRRLQLSQTVPGPATQGEGVLSMIRVENRSLLPCFFLRLDLNLAGASSSLMIPYLGPRSYCDAEAALDGLKRGIYRAGRISVSSTAPIGVILRRQNLSTDCRLEVYPRRLPLGGDWADGGGIWRPTADSAAAARTSSSDYHGVRDYRPDDSHRHIHWRTTARSGRLAVIEYARRTAFTPVFILDLFCGGETGPGEAGSFETAVMITASLVERETRRRRRFGLGGGLDEAAGRGLDCTPDPAMAWLAQARATAPEPLNLSGCSLPWPEATPVFILTSHHAYDGMRASSIIPRFPRPVVIMINGLGFSGGRTERFMGRSALQRLAANLAGAGCRFVLVNSAGEALPCLESL